MRGNDGIGDLRSLEGVGGHACLSEVAGAKIRCCLRGETAQRLVWSGADGKHCACPLHPALTPGYAPPLARRARLCGLRRPPMKIMSGRARPIQRALRASLAGTIETRLKSPAG